jgi:hypothetical protein
MEPIERCARAAAQRLAGEFGERLTIDVEAALHASGASQRPERYFDPISLGGLIVSIATLAWTVYKDLKKTTPQPSQQVMATTIRVQLRDDTALEPAQRDRIIDVVVEETLRSPTTQP